ncbi:MAG TPA: hypothetical protein VGR88_11045 [Ktedonobacterales bacterium]|nr:hypothetical protein [Ktedonobacterales bacterium]
MYIATTTRPPASFAWPWTWLIFAPGRNRASAPRPSATITFGLTTAICRVR